jgi:Domain of unknown function (DUF222)/HNH endonuclease
VLTIERKTPNGISGEDDLVSRMDAAHARACAAQRELFSLILCAEARAEIWARDGARDLAHWLCMRYSISTWKAHRWIQAAHALEDLPGISEAFSSGELGVDKVVELTRLATPRTETRLIRWAGTVSGATIRHRAELAARANVDQTRSADRDRSVLWWSYDEGRRMFVEADLPAADGAVVIKAIERATEQVPAIGGEQPKVAARRADALVGICRSRIATDPDPDRATVVVHVRATPVGGGFEIGSCEIDGGPVIHPQVAGRLMCDARIQAVLEGTDAIPIRLGRISREPSPAMMRLLRYRDRHCRFPGCGSTRFLHAHHIRWWSRGGPTDLDNLILLCTFHHKLVHEHGWKVIRDPDGSVRWFRPGGTPYRAGPSPPRDPVLVS